MRTAYIYALCDPDTEEVRYIGKTVNYPRRINAHYNEKRTTHKCRWLKSLNGRFPVVKLLETIPEDQWEEAEKRQIKLHKEMGCDLTNHTDGGDGRTAFLPEEKAALSNQMKKRMADPEFKKKIFTEERAKKISAAHTGKPHSKEHVAHLPQNNKGFKSSKEATEKRRLAAIGKPCSEKCKQLTSERSKGNTWGIGNKSRTGMENSPEMNAKIGTYQKDRPKTAEQRQKMSLARSEWWKKRKGEENVTQLPSGSSQSCDGSSV
jgi:hypothetical protein